MNEPDYFDSNGVPTDDLNQDQISRNILKKMMNKYLHADDVSLLFCNQYL